MKIYENNEIYVRRLDISDCGKKEYLAWFYDQEVCKYNSHGYFTQEKDPEWVNKLDPYLTITWAVIVKDKSMTGSSIETHIGNVSLTIDWINRKGEFACIFGEKEYWGKGYCTQVLKWIIEHSLNKLNLAKIWLGTAEGNFGMNKAAQKVGMELETIIPNELFINGRYQSINRWVIYADN